jgi:hypothetical protein
MSVPPGVGQAIGGEKRGVVQINVTRETRNPVAGTGWRLSV